MTAAANLYHSVINDVIASVRDSFMDESVDESVLQDLKRLWTTKLEASKTIEPAGAHETGSRSGPLASGRVMGNQRVVGSTLATGGAPAPTPSTMAPGGQQPIVITDPNRLVTVQVTVPAQPGNPASQPRALTILVPAHALQQESASYSLLQSVLTQALTQALPLPESHVGNFVQSQINTAFRINN